jgi:predicted AAA+ superfamily ATPase
MFRHGYRYLETWLHSKSRKPLIVRGARQIGKSYTVREFAKNSKLKLVEINFEKDSRTREIFLTKNAAQILRWIELEHNINLQTESVLIFFDEIQEAPNLLQELRYFKEDFPSVPIIAAGSLLEFVFGKKDFSVPVGRVEFFFMGPMNFEEFLIELGNEKLLSFYQSWNLKVPIPIEYHEQFENLFKVYSFLGGMPEVLKTYFQDRTNILDVVKIQASIIQTYEQDFYKYHKKFDHGVISKVFYRLANNLGRKIKYSEIDDTKRASEVADVVNLLVAARVFNKVYATSAMGIPLKSQIKDKFYKCYYLDIGLYNSILNLKWHEFESISNVQLINNGLVAESLVAQEILSQQEFFRPSELYYWFRDKAGTNAEVDFVYSCGEKIIPIEVKAGASGKLKSLKYFVEENKLNIAIRFYSGEFLVQKKFSDNNAVLYNLPLYLAGRLPRLHFPIGVPER